MQYKDFGKAAPKMELLQKRMNQVVELSVAKAAAYIKSPKDYPLPADKNSVEHAIIKLYGKLKNKDQKDLIKKANEILNASTSKHKQRYGDLAVVNFKATKSCIEQIKNLPLPSHLKLTQAELDDAEKKFTKLRGLIPVKTKTAKAAASQPRGANPKTLSLFLDSITCVKTEDIGKDEIIVKGFTIDSLNRKTDISSIDLGKIKKGETKTLSLKLKDFDLREAGVFPQDFLAGLFLLEDDLMKREITNEYVFAIATITAALFSAGLIIGVSSAAFPPLLVVGIILLGASAALYVFGFMIPAIAEDDISKFVTDSFLFNIPPPIAVGEKFTRTLSTQIQGPFFNKNRGEYKMNIHWERTA